MELSQSVENAYAAGRAAWPGVRLDKNAFAERVKTLALEAENLTARASDIYLATACLARDPAAVLAFERSFLAPVPRLLTRVALSAHQEDELRQQLRIRLLVGPTPRLGEYRAMGPLGGWVRVCALRLALDLKLGADARRGDSDALDALMVGAPGGEVLIDAEHHREAFQGALQEALTTLTPREKTLLRLHFLDGMNIDALGVVFRVHRATVARWLVAIRTQVLDRVRQTLSLDLGASPSEAISLVRLLRSEVQLSIRRILEDGESVRLTDSVILTKPPR
jgi:RNA polymerase sigma-70 factor (ECF subfamily)